MNFRSAFAVLSMTVALTACGQLPFQQSEPEAPAHSGPPTVSPLDQPIETGAEAIPVSTAEASTMQTAMFRAAGNGWVATASDKTAVLERAGAKSVGVTVRRMTYGRGVEFVGSMNGQVFSLNIRASECETGSGKAPFSARLKVGSQSMTGCAAPTDTMPKAQVKAASAAPKPKAAAKPATPAAKPATPASAPAPAPAATPAPAAAPATESASTPETTPAPAAEPATPPAAETPAPAEPAATTPAPAATTPATSAPEAAPAEPAPAADPVPAPSVVLPETPPAAE